MAAWERRKTSFQAECSCRPALLWLWASCVGVRWVWRLGWSETGRCPPSDGDALPPREDDPYTNHQCQLGPLIPSNLASDASAKAAIVISRHAAPDIPSASLLPSSASSLRPGLPRNSRRATKKELRCCEGCPLPMQAPSRLWLLRTRYIHSWAFSSGPRSPSYSFSPRLKPFVSANFSSSLLLTTDAHIRPRGTMQNAARAPASFLDRRRRKLVNVAI